MKSRGESINGLRGGSVVARLETVFVTGDEIQILRGCH
jgi:hypothetical protein